MWEGSLQVYCDVVFRDSSMMHPVWAPPVYCCMTNPSMVHAALQAADHAY